MKYLLGVLGLVLTAGVISPVYADWRSYVWTYEYQTMPKGAAELEYYLTYQLPDRNKSGINTWKHWFEYEYGITNHWDISMYQMWKQANTASKSSFRYDGFKIRTRYRFGEKGQYLVDPLVYLEYIRDHDLSKPNVIEGKLILAKDIGYLNISYNQIFERDLENRGKNESEYAVGISYNVIPALKLGIESKGSYSKRETAVGPTLSWSAKRMWIALGSAWRLNRRTDDLEVRMLVGVPF